MIYCVDIDGTICSHEEDYNNARPFYHRIQQVNDLYDDGHTIVYDTARGSVTGKHWYDITKAQLERWGAKYHRLRTGQKIYADYYLDDKGLNDKDFFEDRI